MTTAEHAARADFYMTVTHADGSAHKGTCTEAQAARSLATASQRGYFIEVLPNGGANIRREVHGPAGGSHWVKLEPARHARKLTPTARLDLALIASRHIAVFVPETGCIKAGYVNSIPPGATSLLRDRGLIALTGSTVTVSLSARLAMLAQDHRPVPWSYEPSAGEVGDLLTAYRSGATGRTA
jgi:hypothetical protein